MAKARAKVAKARDTMCYPSNGIATSAEPNTTMATCHIAGFAGILATTICHLSTTSKALEATQKAKARARAKPKGTQNQSGRPWPRTL